MSDNVNHPDHYKANKYECVDVMIAVFGKEKAMSFMLLCAFKYLWRTDRKNGKEDIEKEIWYLKKYLELNEVSE